MNVVLLGKTGNPSRRYNAADCRWQEDARGRCGAFGRAFQTGRPLLKTGREDGAVRIRLLELLSGAQAATGLTVIIDVFRASSVACYAFAAGAERILPVDSVEEALRLKSEHPDYVVLGERDCLRPEGFDYGNSPSEVKDRDLTGKTLVHATSAGTRGLFAAMGVAERVLFCSFPNVAATAAAIVAAAPETVSLVAMGKAGATPAPEDKLCAMYLANLLQDVPNAFSAIPRFLRDSPSAAIFFGDTAIVPEEDFSLCLNLDAFDFFLEASVLADGRPALFRNVLAESVASA
jgi:2-phosphosulfolactate phosphatase